jgi:putative Mn2+ efflux pump MntP
MKSILAFIGFVLIMILGYYFVIFLFVNSYNTETEKYKKELGKNIVIQNDTLKILDYSFIDENFTLSNGNKVSSIVVFKDAIK